MFDFFKVNIFIGNKNRLVIWQEPLSIAGLWVLAQCGQWKRGPCMFLLKFNIEYSTSSHNYLPLQQYGSVNRWYGKLLRDYYYLYFCSCTSVLARLCAFKWVRMPSFHDRTLFWPGASVIWWGSVYSQLLHFDFRWKWMSWLRIKERSFRKKLFGRTIYYWYFQNFYPTHELIKIVIDVHIFQFCNLINILLAMPGVIKKFCISFIFVDKSLV